MKLICPTLDYLKSQKKNKAEKATKEGTSVKDKVRNIKLETREMPRKVNNASDEFPIQTVCPRELAFWIFGNSYNSQSMLRRNRKYLF